MKLRQAKKIWKKGLPSRIALMCETNGILQYGELIYPNVMFYRAEWRYKKTWTDRDWAEQPQSPWDKAFNSLFHVMTIDRDES